MRSLKMLLPTGLLIAGCAVPAAGPKPCDPTSGCLQGEITALQNTVTALKATVSNQAAAISSPQSTSRSSGQAAAITTLQSTVSSQATAINRLQAELATPAAQSAFALGNYVTVDTTDTTIKGVKAPNIIFSAANVHIVSERGNA